MGIIFKTIAGAAIVAVTATSGVAIAAGTNKDFKDKVFDKLNIVAESDYNNLEKENTQNKTALAAARQELSEKTALYNTLNDVTLPAVRNELETAQTTLAEKTSALTQAQTDLATAQAANTASQTEIEELETAVETAQTNLATAQAANTASQAEIEELETAVEDAEADLATAQATNTTLQEEITELEGDVYIAEADLATAQASVSTLQSQIATLNQELTQAQEDLLETQETVEQLELGLSYAVYHNMSEYSELKFNLIDGDDTYVFELHELSGELRSANINDAMDLTSFTNLQEYFNDNSTLTSAMSISSKDCTNHTITQNGEDTIYKYYSASDAISDDVEFNVKFYDISKETHEEDDDGNLIANSSVFEEVDLTQYSNVESINIFGSYADTPLIYNAYSIVRDDAGAITEINIGILCQVNVSE